MSDNPEWQANVRTGANASSPKKDTEVSNPELRDLGTHMAGATHLHETRHTDRPVAVDPPVSPNPGMVDAREDRFKTKFE